MGLKSLPLGGDLEEAVERGPMLRGVWADATWSVGLRNVEREPMLRGA